MVDMSGEPTMARADAILARIEWKQLQGRMRRYRWLCAGACVAIMAGAYFNIWATLAGIAAGWTIAMWVEVGVREQAALSRYVELDKKADDIDKGHEWIREQIKVSVSRQRSAQG